VARYSYLSVDASGKILKSKSPHWTTSKNNGMQGNVIGTISMKMKLMKNYSMVEKDKKSKMQS
jgi:hypothetical protein